MTSQISKDEVRSAIEDRLCAYFAVTSETATDDQLFQACAMVIREIMSRLLAVESPRAKKKEVHYMSMEFLMGRSLMKNAFNLGISEALIGALEDMGKNATDIFETEPDAGLGNGGLGRLAACYMDSMATLGMEATGYSICYELGIFKQKFENGKQTEIADNWRVASEGWLVPCYQDAVEVRFGGQISAHWDELGHYSAVHTDYTPVIAVPRDMLIAGFEGKEINKLRLWDAESPRQLDMYLFSNAEYVKSLEERTMAEVITKVLYPADEKLEGKILRLKQQYFFVSATAQDIVRKHIEKWGDIRSFGEHHTIQINDTHPTLIIPELMRLFMDEHGLGWDESWEIVKQSVAYTNHTVMSEALERWPQQIIQQLLPRVWEILCEINRRWVNYLIYNFGQDERVGRNLIIRDDQVLMANLCLAACYKVNKNEQYPCLVYVYGGPHSQLVTNNFMTAGPFLHYMAQKGYIIFVLDNRGTSNRGAEFEKCIHRQLGVLESEDQMVGINYLRSLPYVNKNRMGIDGWSFGGFMTLTMVTEHPDIFASATCGGPVVNWEWYEIMYGERYMDTPQENPEGYEHANIINKIHKLKCPLLIMHGQQDNTVVQQHSLELLHQSVLDDVQINYFPYTTHEHNVRGLDRVQMWHKIEQFHDNILMK